MQANQKKQFDDLDKVFKQFILDMGKVVRRQSRLAQGIEERKRGTKIEEIKKTIEGL